MAWARLQHCHSGNTGTLPVGGLADCTLTTEKAREAKAPFDEDAARFAKKTPGTLDHLGYEEHSAIGDPLPAGEASGLGNLSCGRTPLRPGGCGRLRPGG